MNKIIKRLIAILGLIIIGVVFLENVFFTSILADDINEHVTIVFTGFFNLFIVLLIAFGIFAISKRLQNINLNKKIKIILLACFLVIYFVIQVFWINYRNVYPVGDQLSVYETAKGLYENSGNELINSGYMERYPQQISLSYVWNIIFHICSNSSFKIIQYINAIFNVISIVAILLIINQLSKKYETNKFLGVILIGTFISIPLLSTFVYGDFSSLAFSLLSILFIMKYGETEKIRYVIISGLSMAISYILRMNNLIFVIAICIYMFLELIKSKKKIKDVIIKILLILLFAIITFIPATVIKKYIVNKFDLNLENAIPTTCFLYMGMTDGYRQCGWYNDYGAWAWDNPVDEANEMYKVAIKDRIIYFISNPIEMIKFYANKTISMWSENSYASLWYNLSFNINVENKDTLKDENIISKKDNIMLYQKALIIIIFGASILVIIQNRKKLSNEMILLIVIFIGGFLFHIIWEAKSRYIIPYIVVMIPVASIMIKNLKRKEVNKDEKSITSNTNVL